MGVSVLHHTFRPPFCSSEAAWLQVCPGPDSDNLFPTISLRQVSRRIVCACDVDFRDREDSTPLAYFE